MLTRKPTRATQARRTSATVFGLLLYAGARAIPATGADSTDVLSAAAVLNGYFREARASAFSVPRQIIGFKEIRRPADDSAYASFEGVASQARLLAASGRVSGSRFPLSDVRASQGEPEFSLRNPDAVVRAKVVLIPGRKCPAYAYADIGAVDSTLRWQGLAGIRTNHGFELLGGWRHVTYHFRPGMGFDSLDFNGPFLGAALAW